MPHDTDVLMSLGESNIARFERLLPEVGDDETRATLVQLIAEERERLKGLRSAEIRPRKSQVRPAHAESF